MTQPTRRLAPAALAAAILAASPAAATAQQAGAAGFPEIQAGDPVVEGRRIAAGTTTLRMVASQNGQETEIGTVTEEVSRLELAGRAVIQRVQTVRSPMVGTLADTVIVAAETLAPVRHRSQNPQRVMALDFSGKKVTGSVTPLGGEPQPVSAEYDIAIFDSNPLDLVIRALPLKAGYGARIPVYIHELGGKVVVQIRVAGEEPVDAGAGTMVEAWKVEIEQGTQKSTAWIAKASRELLRQAVSPMPGVELKMVR